MASSPFSYNAILIVSSLKPEPPEVYALSSSCVWLAREEVICDGFVLILSDAILNILSIQIHKIIK